MHCIDMPYRVAINEAVELAKSFGGTDGHKYVNGVLDKAAAELRRVEVEAARAAARLTRADARRRVWRRAAWRGRRSIIGELVLRT